MDHDELSRIAEVERLRSKPAQIRCCTSSGCRASGSMDLIQKLKHEVDQKGLAERVEVLGVGCPGLCSRGPIVQTMPDECMYGPVSTAQAGDLVSTLDGGKTDAAKIDTSQPFFNRQFKIVRATAGQIDPERLESHIANGGYHGLELALEKSPAEIIDLITRSGLRGRGGAGYPTGLKWATVAKMPAGQKYVICNGDEGDPGAFMDRAVMEDAAHQVIEGITIAAYAIGANQGYIYVRAEYPLAIERLQLAINQATKAGLLGNGIFGGQFDFNLEIRIGAGAFVCGEETALIASVQGLRGIPRPRPPYPAESGLWEKPTLINNVETFATIPSILRNGADWFAAIGTAGSKGTKIFSLTGKIRNSGLVEVPMGTTIRQVVEEMGGGVASGKPVKAVQTGGPSGGCIPASLLDTPIDYDSLSAIGSIMGSGGMIVMDDTDRMPEVARFFMEFCADESCGKCVPCRVGTVQLHRLLTKIVERKATKSDLEQMIQLSHLVKDTSLCGLGQSASNPVLSTLRYFGEEYDSLLAARRVSESFAKTFSDFIKVDIVRVPPGGSMSVVTLQINDRVVSSRIGETVLEAAKEAGVAIPTLCHMTGISDVAACRMCLVHVEGKGKLQASCTTTVSEGMIVRTDSEQIREYRRMILELLFAEGNHVCSVCVSNGNCELQTLAAENGMDHVRYEYLSPARPVDVSHREFALDHNRCILCTRCVRTCDEIEGAHTWDIDGRGSHSRVIADMGDPWGEAVSCTSCGKCVQACPTGALFRKGSTVSGMTKDRERLADLMKARKEKKWNG